MKKIVTTSLLYLLCTSFAIAATTEEGQRITRLTEQTPKALTTNFTGKASSISMFSARAPMQANGAYVTFEPGARTYWHEHPTGQSLVILEGEGWIGEEGKPKTLVRAGDTVVCPPGVKHWHGATDKSPLKHFAISERRPDKQTAIWYGPVSEEEYKN